MGAPFSALLREFISPGEFERTMIETYMTQILVLTCRDFAGFPGKKQECSVDYKNKAVCEVISYIDNNILFMTGMTDIARRLNYSYSYLSHLFTAEMGISMQEYYNKRRIEMAIQLLKEGDMSVSEIALSLQFQSIHSFSKAFKKASGLPPSKFRGQYKNYGQP
jgi:AraC-like DNA-binding protein